MVGRAADHVGRLPVLVRGLDVQQGAGAHLPVVAEGGWRAAQGGGAGPLHHRVPVREALRHLSRGALVSRQRVCPQALPQAVPPPLHRPQGRGGQGQGRGLRPVVPALLAEGQSVRKPRLPHLEALPAPHRAPRHTLHRRAQSLLLEGRSRRQPAPLHRPRGLHRRAEQRGAHPQGDGRRGGLPGSPHRRLQLPALRREPGARQLPRAARPQPRHRVPLRQPAQQGPRPAPHPQGPAVPRRPLARDQPQGADLPALLQNGRPLARLRLALRSLLPARVRPQVPGV